MEQIMVKLADGSLVGPYANLASAQREQSNGSVVRVVVPL